MREIKFRAWNGGMMRYLHEGDFIIEERGLFAPDEMGDKWKEREWPIMQYTGLKDKNGKEIYEGDILKDRNHFWEIILDSDGSTFSRFKAIMTGKDKLPLLIGLTKDREIIGNIYENPELINTLSTQKDSQENDDPQATENNDL